MDSNTIKILLLQISSMVSPMIFSISLIILSKKNPRLNIFAFFLGSIFVVITLAFLGTYFNEVLSKLHPTHAIRIGINLVISFILLYLALKEIMSEKTTNKKDQISQNQPEKFIKWFFLGIALNATNINSLVANFTALKEINANNIADPTRLFLIIFGIICFTFPILMPMLTYLIIPKITQKILNPIDKILFKYGNYLVALIFIIISSVILYNTFKLI